VAEEESLSPAEHIGRAFHDWLQDHPRRERRGRFEPVEVAIFTVIVAIACLILAGAFAALGDSSGQGFTFFDALGIATQWAQPPLVIAILGATLLASYQNRRSGDELESYLDDDDASEAEVGADMNRVTTSALRHLRRSRLALVCLGLLGLLSAAAGITLTSWDLQRGTGLLGSTTRYAYAAIVVGTLAVVIPALACVVIAARGWTRGSYLLKGDEQDAGFGNEPEQPAKAESVP